MHLPLPISYFIIHNCFSLGNLCGCFWLVCCGFGFRSIAFGSVFGGSVFLGRVLRTLGFRSRLFAAGGFLRIIGHVPSFPFVNDARATGNDSLQAFLNAMRACDERRIAHPLECFGGAMAMRAAVFVGRHNARLESELVLGWSADDHYFCLAISSRLRGSCADEIHSARNLPAEGIAAIPRYRCAKRGTIDGCD